MIDTIFFKFRGGQNFLITVGGFYNEREYSGADWMVPLLLDLVILSFRIFKTLPIPNLRAGELNV